MLELTLRLVLSLALVLGLMLLLARLVARRTGGQRGDLVTVLHRQPLTRGSSVSVVSVGSRVLVLGTTEQQVRVLAELDPDEVEVPAKAAVPADRPTAALGTARGAHRADVPAPALVPHARPVSQSASQSAPRPGSGALAGSVLSPATWRQALAAATRRAS